MYIVRRGHEVVLDAKEFDKCIYELDELRRIVSTETPHKSLDIAQTLRVEKARLLTELQAKDHENSRLKRNAEILANRIDMWTQVGR